MQIGMIGLGRMGSNMVRRMIMRGEHDFVVFSRCAESFKSLHHDHGVVGTVLMEDFVVKMTRPRTVWLMVPAAAVDEVLAQLIPILEEGDIVIDGGNSHYQDDISRAAKLKEKGLHYVDVGTSGGIVGLERGYCLMIGGEKDIVQHLDPLFASLAPGVGTAPPTPDRHKPGATAEQGYLHCGPHGSGHFVKMVHNGIEYALMAAYAEGLSILRNADIGKDLHDRNAETTPLRNPEYYQYTLDLPEIAEVWRHGSVITSWLLDLTAAALAEDSELSEFSSRVSDSGEGRWTVQTAIEEGVPTPVINAALLERFASRGNADFANRILSAMRKKFGGHVEKNKQK